MPGNRYTAEAIIHKLREADFLLGHGRTVGELCKAFGVTLLQTYYRWRKDYGGKRAPAGEEAEGT